MVISFFSINLQAVGLELYEKEILAHMFSSEFCKTFRDTFSKEHFRTTASVFQILLLAKLFDMSDFSLVETKHTTVIFL